MDTNLLKPLATLLLLLILFKSSGNTATWVVGSDGAGWDGNVTQNNTVKVQATGNVELNQLVDDYVSYWRFDENSGSTVHDENTTNNNSGTMMNMNSVGWIPGYRDNFSLEFDGVNDYIDCGNNVSLESPIYSVSFWFKTNNLAAYQELIKKYHFDGTDAYGFIVGLNPAGYIEFTNYRGSSWSFFQAVTGQIGEIIKDTWYYVTCTYDGLTAKYYLNKMLQNAAGGTNFKSSNAHFSISDDYYTVNGIIDEVKFYDRAISETEIGQIMDNEHYSEGSIVSNPKNAESIGTIDDVWSQISFSARIPSNTSVDLYIRTSFDNGLTDPWTDWTLLQTNAATETKYDLPVKNKERCGQWKLELKTNDAAKTPQIQNVNFTSGKPTGKGGGQKISVGPNPFIPARPPYNKVYFTIVNPSNNSVKLEIYSPKGRLVFEKDFSSSETVFWDGRNNDGETAEDGGYIYQLKMDGKTYTGTIILAR